MASTIKALPTEVVYLISAGEVIDSLTAVVRELVENALDANATRIVISIWPQHWKVRVADNGDGINLDNLHKAATAHSTSKIHFRDDLWRINSLGFRGEALHSLATLADLEIISRAKNETEGWRINYNHQGEIEQIEIAAIAPGTVVTVSNLFAHTSPHHQSLPPQIKSVQNIIQNIALCYPHVTYQVWQNDKEWFTIYPANTAGKLIPQVLNQVKYHDLYELHLPITNIENSSLNLVIGLPDRCHRHRADWIKIAINGRIIKSPELEQTIISGFHKTLPRDRYPVCFLHLTISPDQINWNRHPAKTEIYLNEINFWQTQITEAINKALQISEANIKESFHTTRVSNLIKVAESKGQYNFKSANNSDNAKNEENQQENKEDNKLYLKAIAQVNNTYIVAEHSGGMWLVEQHIAHERVLYEKICDQWQIVPIEPAIILYQISNNQVAQLQRIGLEIEPFGEQIWAVRNTPLMLKEREDIAEAILELSWGGDLQTAQVAVACRTAIRNGTTMNLPEMQQLLDDWQKTRNPRTCPHGRPIYLSLEETALARFFRRNWVIGKSHGI